MGVGNPKRPAYYYEATPLNTISKI